jgi:hypothetical protein
MGKAAALSRPGCVYRTTLAGFVLPEKNARPVLPYPQRISVCHVFPADLPITNLEKAGKAIDILGGNQQEGAILLVTAVSRTAMAEMHFRAFCRVVYAGGAGREPRIREIYSESGRR